MGKRERTLLTNPLFEGIEEGDIARILPCLRPKTISVPCGTKIEAAGEIVNQLGFLMAGKAEVIDDSGIAIKELTPGMSWGEVYACAGAMLPYAVIASTDCEVLRIDCRRALTTCDHSCKPHHRLMRNLVGSIARESVQSREKLHILSQRTTRTKLMVYLRTQAQAQGSDEFTIPLDRQGLADYLGVERTAMSTEIGKLVKDGIIQSKKSWFKLL